jgi:hypothetical protein
MFADEIRRAVMAAPRVELPKVSALLWKAYAAGQVSEAEASELSEMIEARKVIPVEKPIPRRMGSRPRSSESMERRRRWVASGRLPPQIAARFTMAEAAVLAVIAVEVAKRGACTLTIGHIAALGGVSETTVHNALRQARGLGLLTIEERRLTAWRNASNVVRIVSPEWQAWLRLNRPQGGGCKFVNPTPTDSRTRASLTPMRGAARAAGGQGERTDGAHAIENPPRPRSGWQNRLLRPDAT